MQLQTLYTKHIGIHYFGDPNQNGTIRHRQDGNTFYRERRVDGEYVIVEEWSY